MLATFSYQCPELFLSTVIVAIAFALGRASNGIVLGAPTLQHSQKAADRKDRPSMPVKNTLIKCISKRLPIVHCLYLVMGRNRGLVGHSSAILAIRAAN